MRKGDKITVGVIVLDMEHVPGATWTSKIEFRRGTVRNQAGGRITYDWEGSIPSIEAATRRNIIFGTDTVAYAARGTEWARGWDGEEVEALKVAAALL